MKVEEVIGNKERIDEFYNNYVNKNLIQKSKNPLVLKKAHLIKAKHNLDFSQKIINFKEYTDWIIISLYYSLYHSFLSLLENKGYSSKNHNATLIFILKHYIEFGKDELELFENLKMSEDDAIFYTSLKEKRNEASYSTNISFNNNDISTLLKKVKKIISKVNKIIENE